VQLQLIAASQVSRGSVPRYPKTKRLENPARGSHVTGTSSITSSRANRVMKMPAIILRYKDASPNISFTSNATFAFNSAS